VNGSVVKKGGRWYVKIELDPDPTTGRRRQKWHSGFPTRREAERARIDLLSRRDRGVYVEPSRQTVGEYLSEWLQAIRPTIRQSTFDSYSRNLQLHVASRIGRVRLNHLDAGILNRLYADLLLAGRQPPSRQGAGYSPAVLARAKELRALGCSLSATAETLRSEVPEACNLSKDTLASLLRREESRDRAAGVRPAGLDPRTVAYIHSIMHRALKDAVRWDRLARNPADAADPPRASQREGAAAAWDSDTLRRFLVAARDSGDRLYPLWVLLATTGMRRGEASGCDGVTSTSRRGACGSCRPCCRPRAPSTSGSPRPPTGVARSPSIPQPSPSSGLTEPACCRTGSSSGLTSPTEASSSTTPTGHGCGPTP
jgi:integrase